MLPVDYQAIIEDLLKDRERRVISDQHADVPSRHPKSDVGDPDTPRCDSAVNMESASAGKRPIRSSVRPASVSRKPRHTSETSSSPRHNTPCPLVGRQEQTPRCMEDAGDSTNIETKKRTEISNNYLSDCIKVPAETCTLDSVKLLARDALVNHTPVIIPEDLAVWPIRYSKRYVHNRSLARHTRAVEPATSPEPSRAFAPHLRSSIKPFSIKPNNMNSARKDIPPSKKTKGPRVYLSDHAIQNIFFRKPVASISMMQARSRDASKYRTPSRLGSPKATPFCKKPAGSLESTMARVFPQTNQ